MTERPLETGWLPDTPVGDTLLRRFVHNQIDLNDELARAAGGRSERTPDVALTDTGGIAMLNQAVLLRALTSADDPALDDVRRFYAPAGQRGHLLLSIWPTPDLTPRGWALVGHPAFVVRAPSPHDHRPRPDVEVRTVPDPDALATAERIIVEGFPIDEARGLAPGAVLPSALLDGDVAFRLGLLAGEPVAMGGCYVGHGVVNLCMAATLDAARRRGVWQALVWARVDDAPHLPAVAFTSDLSRPGFERMGFLPLTRFTLWAMTG